MHDAAAEYMDALGPAPTTPGEALARERMWSCAAGTIFEHVNTGLFELQQRCGAVACCMHAVKGVVENVGIELEDNQCVVLGRNAAEITLSNVTFQGAVLLSPFR